MPQFPIYITAIDKTTATIDRINKKLEAINAPIERMRKSMAKLGEVSGLNKLGESFRRVASYALAAFRNITRVVAPLGIITGALSIAGMGELVKRWGDFGMKLGFAAQNMGVSAQQLHGLEGASRLAGGSADGLASALQTLGANMTDAIGGRNAEALQYFNALGINIRDVHNHARSVAAVMPEVADKIAAIKDPFLQARIATEMFGAAGMELLPLWRRGSAGIADLVQKAIKYGAMSDEDAAAARRLGLAQAGLNLAIDGFINRLSVKLSPILSPLLDKLADWVGTSQDVKNAIMALASGVHDLADWLKSIDWKGVGHGIKDFVKGANDAAQAVGGWGRAVEILFGLWVGAKFLGVMANIAKMALAIKALLGPGAVAAAAGVPGAAGLGAAAAAGVVVGLPLLTKGDTPGADVPGGTGSPEQKAQIARDVVEWNRRHGGATPNVPAGAPRGIRNNNPLNLEYHQGQGAVGSDGRFGRYASMAEGVAAAERQLLRYQERRGLNTVRGIIGRWAPSGDNDTASYIDYVARRMGISPDAKIDLHNAGTAQALIAAMAHREEGRDIDSGAVAQGVSRALGVPVLLDKGALAGAPGAPGPSGGLDVTIRHNMPASASVSVHSSGDAVKGAPKVERAMPDFQAA